MSAISHHPFRRAFAVIAALFLLALVPVSVAPAQEEAPPVLIRPVDGANLLPGALFDLHVEVHASRLPRDFAITINGESARAFFGVRPITRNWIIASSGVPAQAVTFRGVRFDEPGEYVVEVTAGGETHTKTYTVRETVAGDAQNVILFVADGGSQAFYTALRLVSRGMTEGVYDDALVWDEFEEIGLLHTSGIDSIITDSANSASAYNTGHKTAVNATGSYPDTSASTLDDPKVETLAEILVRTRDMSIGVVTTSDITDATPAAVWAHGRDRSSGSRANFATQVIANGLMPEVMFGGGGQYFIPSSAEGSRRRDSVDVFALYENNGYTIVTTASELEDALGEDHVLGIFNSADMNTWLDRNVFTDNASRFPDQPGLVEMTTAAIEILSTNENGFYLMVEAASIDKQLHPMDFDRALADGIEFERAVAAAYEWAQENSPNTLIIVTSDHAHSYDVWGTVDVEEFNAATTNEERVDAIGIYGGAGFPTYEDADGDFFPDDWAPSIVLAQGKADNPPFTEDFQVSPVPRVPSLIQDDINIDNPEDDPNGIVVGGNLPNGSNSSAHTLQDVPVYATGPGADCFGRVMENTEVFFCMANAIGLDPSAETGMAAGAELGFAAPNTTLGQTAATSASLASAESTPAATNILWLVALGIAAALLAGAAGGYVFARRQN